MSMSGEIQAGYAIRRVGECLSQETTNTTWHPWVVCCPDTLSPVNYGDNEQCNAHITDTGPVPYDCANSTWNLWSHSGYFCCEEDQAGFWISDENNWAYTSYGCEKESLVRKNSSLTIANLQSSSTPTPKSGPNKGAIAGGVVGGVCGLLILAGLLWFFLRKRRSRTYARQDEVSMDSNPRAGSHSGYDTSRRETSELEGSNEARGELYDPSPLRNELPADDRLRMELNGDLPQEVKVVKQGSASELP